MTTSTPLARRSRSVSTISSFVSLVAAAFSKDGGKTWHRQGSPVFDAVQPYDQGSMPQYAPDGSIYVVSGRPLCLSTDPRI